MERPHFDIVASGERMKEIQAVNSQRKEAIANGMTMEEAMKKYQ